MPRNCVIVRSFQFEFCNREATSRAYEDDSVAVGLPQNNLMVVEDLPPAEGTAGGEVKVHETNKKYKIGGCEVSFPHKAYGTQLSFMSKVIASLEQGENALLEAPTGSGKTLSLLCSALAWQEKEKRRLASLEGGKFFEGRQGQSMAKEPVDQPPPAISLEPATSPRQGGFIPNASQKEVETAKPGPPRIYYATRTHSQIQQVVAELKRCGYKPKMAILGSKQHYCINSFVRNKPSIDEACEEFLKNSSCKYFSGSIARLTSSHPQLHDVEDLCRVGKQKGACPFFVSKELAKEADIVFGPYNYFIDPVIRRSMQIEMDNSVFVFDEAHNIEDVCREGGSLDVSLEVVNDMVASLTRACKHNMRPEVYDPLLSLVTTMKNWMMREDSILKQQGARDRGSNSGGRGRGGRGSLAEKLWQGKQLLQHLNFMGLGAERVEILWTCYERAREHDEEMMQEERKKAGKGQAAGDPAASTQTSQAKSGRIGAMTLGTLSRIVQIVGILHNQCEDGGRDYRLVLARTTDQERGMSRRRQAPKDAPGGLVNVTLSLWCLNPGIIFKPIASKSHSVVLTSGTLSPLDSFSSELGTSFEVSLEAPHVVNMQKQVLAGVLSTDSRGTALKATYQNSSKPEFQDGVGGIILSMCSTVPDGLLVFFPSYAMMEKLILRWKETGAFESMTRLKPFVQEPRVGGSEALKKTMNQYYRGIRDGAGGLFFAVCRGKVSEGLDFSDQNARGVVVVGIPYPNLVDSKVNAKKEYNDCRARSVEGSVKNLLTGDRWYEQQAFRALNQALGRCIRHKNDWGTIILVDERFKSIARQTSLSRWMRSNLNIFAEFSQCMVSMEEFFKRLSKDPDLNQRKEREPEPKDVADRKDAIQMLMGGRFAPRKKAKMGAHGGVENDDPESSSVALASFQPAQIASLSPGSGMAQAVEEALREVPIGLWVRKEVQDWTSAAISKGISGRVEAIERAMEGIIHVFQLAEDMDFSWTAKLALGIPGGIQAIFHDMLTDMHGNDSSKVDVSLLGYGKQRKWDELDQGLLLRGMKKRYQEIMEDVRLEMLEVCRSHERASQLENGNMDDGRANGPAKSADLSELPPAGGNHAGALPTPPSASPPGQSNVADEIRFLEEYIPDDSDEEGW